MNRKVVWMGLWVACGLLIVTKGGSGSMYTWVCFCPSGREPCNTGFVTCGCGSCTGELCDNERRVNSYDFYFNGSVSAGEGVEYTTKPCIEERKCARANPNQPCSPTNACVSSGNWWTTINVSVPAPVSSCFDPC